MKTKLTERARIGSATLLALGVSLMLTNPVMADPHGRYRTHLTGDEEVPRAVMTRAQGQAIFKLSDDGTELYYKLIVANIRDVLQAHIHVGFRGENGPVVAFLYPDGPPAVLIPGRTQGVLGEGVITAEDLRGPLEGMTMADVGARIEAGQTYVNVHTTANPGGEIRGQIK